MRFDLRELAPADRYKIVTGVVVPRPIAWVTTLNPDGSPNAAPFSFFGLFGSDPPLVGLGVGNHAPERPKDTGANIRRSGEFVINLVSADLAGAMNATATEFPAGHDELAVAGLTAEASFAVAPPRIAAAPVQLECRELSTLEVRRTRLILGEVLVVHVRDEFVLDPAKFYIDSNALGLIGRMGGRGGYVRTTDTFELPRVPYAAWLAAQEEQERAGTE